MMPGDSHSKMAAIAADATVGNCQKCSVLHQSLTEYVSSFLALKQKITHSDNAIRLEQQREELQIRLVSLEKKVADYEAVQAELEEKKDALKGYERMSEEMEKLKQQNSTTMEKDKKLEDLLKDAKELIATQSLENSELRRGKTAIENDLLETQTYLKKVQAQADQVEKLIEEKAKITSIKENLENKVKLLEDSVSKQNRQISQMTKDKILLQRNIDDLQLRLIILERERNKEYRSTSTQARVPEEPKIDKEKFQMLLQNLWACVEPQKQPTANLFHSPESASRQTLPPSPQSRHRSPLRNTSTSSCKISDPHSYPRKTKATFKQLQPSPEQKAIKQKVSLQSTISTKQTVSPKKGKRLSKEHKTKDSSTDLGCTEISVEEIMAMFQPPPPCISPPLDLETKMDSTETTVEEKENHHKIPDSVLHHQEESFLITTSVTRHSPESSALPPEENVDLPVVVTQEVVHISKANNSKDLRINELNGITEMKDKSSTDCAEIHLQEDMQIEQDPVNEHLVSASSCSTSDTAVLVEAVSLIPESQEASCSANCSSSGASSISGNENALGKTKEGHSETIAKMDVDTSPRDVTGPKTVTPNGGESSRESDTTALSEPTENTQLSPVTSSTFINSATHAEVTDTENSLELGKRHQDSCGLEQSSKDDTVSKTQENNGCLAEDTDLPDNKPCLSSGSDDLISVSNQNAEQRLESDAALKPGEESQNDAQETAVADVAASTSDSNGDSRPPTTLKSPLLKRESECPADQEADLTNANEVPSQKDADVETMNIEIPADQGSSLSDCQEAVNCESLEENIHSVCRQLSPSCLIPSLEVQETLETHPNSEKCNEGVNFEHISMNKESPQDVPKLGDDGVTEKAKEDLQDSTETNEPKVSKYNLRSTRSATSIKSATPATNGQNKGFEPCTKVVEKQSPHVIREEDSSPVAISSTHQLSECIGQVRSEMGPPLPRLLTPVSTPPKPGKSINPRQAIGKLSFPSPMDRLASPTTPVQAHLTPNSQLCSSLTSPLPSNVPSSPLQFGSATPKHALPVPGRLPLTTMNSSPSSSSSPSQENSMRILDSMYPELSAHARTLSILRGNVSLSVCSSESGTLPTTTDSQMSCFKTVNSTSTAFRKTEIRGIKRQADNLPRPKSVKCLKLDNCSPTGSRRPVFPSTSNSGDETPSSQTLRLEQPKNETTCPLMAGGESVAENLTIGYLKKIEDSCFDLLPVIQSHLYVGNMPKKPVLRDEEKEVISEICQGSSVDAENMIRAILNLLKTEKCELNRNYMQALCRVYTGICRQKRDWEKVHILAHSLLTQDFPDSAKLILFMVTTWPMVFTHSSSLCQAIHTVTKLKAEENILRCLSAFLSWEKSPPCDIDELISRTLSDIRCGSSRSFIKSDYYGHDVGTEAWQHVLTMQLLCTHKKWKWTYDHLLGKELWPIMNTWVTQPRGQQAPVSDVVVATVLRLIGCLGRLGIKERCVSSVITIANVINTFGRHGQAEGVPWEVQLAAIYCIYDLAPSNPKQALEAVAEWRGETSRSVPPAVTSYINQLSCVCRQVVHKDAA